MRGDGRSKGCFWRVRCISAPLKSTLATSESLGLNRENVAVHFRVLEDRFSARRLLSSFSQAKRLRSGPPNPIERAFRNGDPGRTSIAGPKRTHKAKKSREQHQRIF